MGKNKKLIYDCEMNFEFLILGFKVQQRYVLTVALFIGITIAIAERSVLSMAITRMVEIPNQNATVSSKVEPICEAPQWALNGSSGTIVIDQAVI